METGNIQIVPLEQEVSSKSKINVSDLWHKCLKNWYWFIISVAACCAIAFLLILKTRPMYHSSAMILIKEASARRMATSDIESVLNFSGGSSMSSKVVNEVIAFRSPALMMSVVERLGLQTEYSKPGLLRSDVLYGPQVPFSISFLDCPSTISSVFQINPKADSSYVIDKFKYVLAGKDYEVEEPLVAKMRDTVQTSIGRLVVTPNPYFKGKWKKAIKVTHNSVGAVASSFLARFKAESEDVKNHSDVISLSIVDPSLQRANDVLGMLITIYNENWVEDKNRMAISTSEFINNRLASLETELGSVDQDIAGFKSANLIPEVDNMSGRIMDQSRDNMRMIQELDNQLYMYRYLRTYLSNNNGTEQLIPMGPSLSSSGVSSQIAEYNKTLLNRNGIVASSSEKNPLVNDLDASLKVMRSAIEASVNNQASTLESQIASLKGKEQTATAMIAKSPSQMKYLTTVGRQQKVKESLYLYLLQKREENELSQAFTAYNTRVITPPMGKSDPVSPHRRRMMMIAVILGILLPLLIIYGRMVTDNSIHSRKDIEGLSLPYLGEIPLDDAERKRKMLCKLKSKKKRGADSPKLLVQEGNRNIINESFRVLRTNLEFMLRGVEHPVLILTSFNPGSGKTFLSMNIAASLAIKGKKVLVIDGDLRRGSTSEYVGKPKTGISEYLSSEEESVEKYIVKMNGFDNLFVIPVGTIPPNPSELIGSGKFSEMVEKLRKTYDVVLIDCPPVDIVADTQIIGDLADRTIFVARAGLLGKSMIPDIQKLYSEKRFKNMSLVLNGTTETPGKIGYGYYRYARK